MPSNFIIKIDFIFPKINKSSPAIQNSRIVRCHATSLFINTNDILKISLIKTKIETCNQTSLPFLKKYLRNLRKYSSNTKRKIKHCIFSRKTDKNSTFKKRGREIQKVSICLFFINHFPKGFFYTKNASIKRMINSETWYLKRKPDRFFYFSFILICKL